jgi:hypothetical protein
MGNQPGVDRVCENIAENTLQFTRITYYMIITLVLPERTRSTECLVRIACGTTLQTFQRIGKWVGRSRSTMLRRDCEWK